MYVCVCMYMYVCMYVCVYMYVYVCICVCMYVCIYVCVCVCVCVYIGKLEQLNFHFSIYLDVLRRGNFILPEVFCSNLQARVRCRWLLTAVVHGGSLAVACDI